MNIVKSILYAACPLVSLSTQGAVVLQVNISDPSAVTFTATSAASSTTSTLSMSLDGITIDDFFTSAQTYAASTAQPSGDLRSNLGSSNFYGGFGTFVFEDNDGSFKAGTDLSVYEGTGGQTQVFTAGETAFTGTATFDFSGSAAFLPSLGTTGNVYTGYFQSGEADQGELIGEWQVVPEPSGFALFIGFAAAGALGFRRLARR